MQYYQDPPRFACLETTGGEPGQEAPGQEGAGGGNCISKVIGDHARKRVVQCAVPDLFASPIIY